MKARWAFKRGSRAAGGRVIKTILSSYSIASEYYLQRKPAFAQLYFGEPAR